MTNKFREKEHVWVVVRYDNYKSPESAFSIKEILRSRELAEAEAARLNRVNADKCCRYWVLIGRLFPEGKSASVSDETLRERGIDER